MAQAAESAVWEYVLLPHCRRRIAMRALPSQLRAVPTCIVRTNANPTPQEKRYRSMQEHIRRAHPEHYISKLPATEESFQLMINTPPSERPPQQQAPTSHSHSHSHPQQSSHTPPFGSPFTTPTHVAIGQKRQRLTYDPGYQQHERNHYSDNSGPGTPRQMDEQYAQGPPGMLPAASAAQALASLHNTKMEEWDSEPVRHPLPHQSLLDGHDGKLNWRVAKFPQDWQSDGEMERKGMRAAMGGIELPPLRRMQPTSDPFNPLNERARTHLSALLNSPPGRSSTLPPIQRHPPGSRGRKNSISKRPTTGRKRSGIDVQGESRLQQHMRRMSYERKAYSAEPGAGYGKRWEDLIDAATSATEDVNEDRTPVCLPAILKMEERNEVKGTFFGSYAAKIVLRDLFAPILRRQQMRRSTSTDISADATVTANTALPRFNEPLQHAAFPTQPFPRLSSITAPAGLNTPHIQHPAPPSPLRRSSRGLQSLRLQPHLV